MAKYRIIRDFGGKFLIQKYVGPSRRNTSGSNDGWEDDVWGNGFKTLDEANNRLDEFISMKRFVPEVYREEEI